MLVKEKLNYKIQTSGEALSTTISFHTPERADNSGYHKSIRLRPFQGSCHHLGGLKGWLVSTGILLAKDAQGSET